MRSGIAQGIARGVGAACFLVLPALLLGSFLTVAQAEASNGPSLDDARAHFFALVDDTQQLAGGTWQKQDDPDSRGCTLSDGTQGRTFSALRIAADPTDSLNQIEKSWSDLGFAVERTEIGPVSQVVATGEGGEILIFRVSDRAMTLQGESECRPAS